MSKPFAIVVTVQIDPKHVEAFEPLILENARAAVRDEPACQQFHVMRHRELSDTFIFYEVYDTPESLEIHRNQPHFIKYFEATQHMIVDRKIEQADVLQSGYKT